MQCDLCGRSTYVYTGLLNPWYECAVCGAVYCDRCCSGEEPDDGYVTPEDLYQVSRSHSCPRCDSPLVKK